MASLTLNLLVIGFAIGAAWRFQHHRGDYRLGARLDRLADGLPDAKRDRARQILRTALPEARQLRRQVRAARAELARTVAAEPFDKTEFAARQQTLLDASVKLRAKLLQTLGALAEDLDQAERRALLRNWRRRGRRRRGPRREGPPSR